MNCDILYIINGFSQVVANVLCFVLAANTLHTLYFKILYCIIMITPFEPIVYTTVTKSLKCFFFL